MENNEFIKKVEKARGAGIPIEEIYSYTKDKGQESMFIDYLTRNVFEPKGYTRADVMKWLGNKGLIGTGEISAITGQPVPTQDEAAQMTEGGRETIIKEGAPIAGDIALSMVAPQFKIATTAPRAARWGLKGLNLLSRMGASGLGSGAGEFAGQALTGEKLNPDAAMDQAIYGAAGEGVTSGVGLGVRLGKDYVLPKATEALGDFLKITNIAKRSYKTTQDKVIKETSEKAKNFVSDLYGPQPSKFESGMAVGDIFKEKTSYEGAYKKFNKAVGEEIAPNIELEYSTQFLGELANKYGDPSNPEVRKLVINQLGYKENSLQANMVDRMLLHDTVKTEDIQRLLANVNKGKPYKELLSDNIEARNLLKKTLMQDIKKESFKAAVNKKIGDQIFKRATSWLNDNPTAKRAFGNALSVNYKGLKGYEINPAKTVDNLFNTGRPDDLLKIKTELMKAPGGKEAWAALEFHWLNDMFEKSISDKRILRPVSLIDNIKKKEEVIKRVMPDVWPKLDNYMKELEGVQPHFAREDLSFISAYDLLSDRSKFYVQMFSKGVGFTAKQAGKSGAHIIGGVYGRE